MTACGENLMAVVTLAAVQPAAPDDGVVAECAVVRVATALPIGATSVDELNSVLVAQRFEAHPGQPWSEVLETGRDRRPQRSCVVGTPEAEDQPWGDDLGRKSIHDTKVAHPVGYEGG